MSCVSPINCGNGESVSDLKGANCSRSSMTGVAAGHSQSLDLAITTAEGDRVTLSSASSATVAYATYEGAVTAQAFSTTRSNEFSLSIEGDLSKSELRDIAKAIHTYNKAVKDISSGRMHPAEVHARQLNRLDEIESFSATFISRQFFAARTQTAYTEISA